jgi:uncharacterized protein YecT (DUF1311 family)
MKQLVIFLCVFLSLSPALAEDAVQERDCREPQTQTAMNICATREYQAVQSELDSILEHVRNKIGLDIDKLELFNDTQESWIRYRDATCGFVAGEREDSGSIWPLHHASCMELLTRQRMEIIPYVFMDWDYEVPSAIDKETSKGQE